MHIFQRLKWKSDVLRRLRKACIKNFNEEINTYTVIYMQRKEGEENEDLSLAMSKFNKTIRNITEIYQALKRFCYI